MRSAVRALIKYEARLTFIYIANLMCCNQNMWTRQRYTRMGLFNISKPSALILFFTAITDLTLRGRISTRCWNMVTGICFYSVARAAVRSGSGLAFQFIPEVFGEVRVWALCRPSFSVRDSIICIFMDLILGGIWAK